MSIIGGSTVDLSEREVGAEREEDTMCFFSLNAVAFVIDRHELPPDVIISNTSTLASKSVKCLGDNQNTDLILQLYRVVDSVLVTQDPPAVCYKDYSYI